MRSGPVGVVCRTDLEQAAHHRGQQGLGDARGVPAGQRGDPQGAAVPGEGGALPGVQTESVSPAVPRPQRPGGPRRREDRHVGVEVPAGLPIPVVAVQVREDDGVQGRQVTRVHGRLGEPLGRESFADVGPLALVQEVGVGQHPERPELEQRRRGPDERQPAGRHVGHVDPGKTGQTWGLEH